MPFAATGAGLGRATRSDWRDGPKFFRLVETVIERPKIEPVHEAHFGPGIGAG